MMGFFSVRWMNNAVITLIPIDVGTESINGIKRYFQK